MQKAQFTQFSAHLNFEPTDICTAFDGTAVHKLET